ncbi:GNAT family N-acetyltransferase [Pseudactinotalea sp. Z1739]|uniref:GNAT family N-acetyltransferase n=1 Tax=Pseudactinotalea sp. Z1739 TaxID=3413028 RepID=UPI003C79B498
MIVRVAVPADVTAAPRREPPGAAAAVGDDARRRAGEATYLVAREADEVIGGVLVARGELRHLQVDSRARGRGVGTALIAAAEDLLREQGHDHATLGVELGNHRARALYLRLGYVATGRTETVSYADVADDGTRRRATETNEELCKDLR